MLLIFFSIISFLSLSAGNLNSISSSNLLFTARSKKLILFVAPIVITPVFGFIPSSSVNNELTISETSPLNDWNCLCNAIASISSINIIEGAFLLAFSYNSCIWRAPSPTWSPIKLVALTKYNGTLRLFANALTSIVLPVPGSP